MKPYARTLAALVFVVAPLTAVAQDGQGGAAALYARIDQLEQENRTLRMQWGQTTMELDRVRKQVEAARTERVAAPAPAEPAAEASTPVLVVEPAADASPGSSATPEAELEAMLDASPSPPVAPAIATADPSIHAELDRLREENQELRRENADLRHRVARGESGSTGGGRSSAPERATRSAVR